jgi:ectoine hydroxylase-related dioxygenase (phytanoyl-CoA dioxygenase family)
MERKPTITITQAQFDHYHRFGYLSIPCITTPDEIAFIREVYDRLFAERRGRDEGNQFDLGGTDREGEPAVLPQILGPSKYAPELKDTLYRANALAISRQLLGPKCVSLGEHAILKPARFGAETPWHQDEAYWGANLQYNSLSVWMPLQEATLENGCMHFIPGSHLWEVLPHHSINHDPRVHGLEIDNLDTSTAVACPLPPGGATFHHNRTCHYAPQNRSTNPRRAYILGFGLKPMARKEPRRFPWIEQQKTAREERAAKALAMIKTS